MASDVDICNLALSHIGEDANVSSIVTPDSVPAEHCQRFYPIARDAVISLVEPHFAIKRVNLALLALAAPDYQPDTWTYAYSYPNGLRVLSVGLPEATLVDADRQDWDSEALTNGTLVIYTNTEQATARVLNRITDTTKFGPLLVEAIARRLAAYLAGPIIKGIEGVKVSGAQYKIFNDIDYPNAARENKVQSRGKLYRDFTPSSLAARA